MDIGPLTWRERQLVLDDRIHRARRDTEYLRDQVTKMPDKDADVLFDLVVEKKRDIERLESMKRSGG